jgi:taurine dioxygenase
MGNEHSGMVDNLQLKRKRKDVMKDAKVPVAQARIGQGLIPPVDPKNVALLAKHGITLTQLEPMGVRVTGLDFKKRVVPPAECLEAIQMEMAIRGFVVFAEQGVLSGDEQVWASELWGGRKMHSTHGVHPQSPNRHIFRLSNDNRKGTNGVGPQWHNDGSFVEGTFSHVGYHIVRVPENGGDTQFCHQGGAFDTLPPEKQERWERLVSVNSSSGVCHPLVHAHPISGRKSVWLHLGMTGAFIEVTYNGDEQTLRALEHQELWDLMNEYNDLMDAGVTGGTYGVSYRYQPGDCVVIDNLAIAHRASAEAHMSAATQGLRIMHRTTVKAMQPFLPGHGLPQFLNIKGPNPFKQGIWHGEYIGFRWDDSMHMQN